MHRTFGSTFSPRFAIAAIASISLFVVVAGCSSSSDGATPDAGSTTCDLAGAQAIFTAKGCAQSGCHDATGTSAGLNLAAADLGAELLGKSPGTGGLTPSSCTNMNKVYLVKGSNPATGLFIDKLTATPGCGLRMPLTGAPLDATQMACVKSWATSVTTAP